MSLTDWVVATERPSMQDALNMFRPIAMATDGFGTLAAPESLQAHESLQTPESLQTLESLALKAQSLPLMSLASVVALLVGGLILLLFGQRLLKPVLVAALFLASVLFAPPVLALVFTSIGAGLATALGVAIGVVLAAITWRVALGATTGVVAASLAVLLVISGIEAGLIDARTPTGGTASDAAASTTGADNDGTTSLAAVAARDERLARSPEFVRPLVAWADDRWHAEPAQVRTLLKAAAAGGAFIGFVLGVWLPQSSAAFLTSVVGGLFAVSGALPLAAHLAGRPIAPVAPIGWLLLWAALALAGWLFQSSRAERGRAREEERGNARGKARADRPARP
jgi:hypothetical protein